MHGMPQSEKSRKLRVSGNRMTPEFTDLRWRLVAEREYAGPTYRK